MCLGFFFGGGARGGVARCDGDDGGMDRYTDEIETGDIRKHRYIPAAFSLPARC